MLALDSRIFFVTLNRQIHNSWWSKSALRLFFSAVNNKLERANLVSEGDGGGGVSLKTDGGSGVTSDGDGGSGVTSDGDGGSSVSLNGDGDGGGLGVGAGLEDGLVNVGGGSNGSDDGLLGEDGFFAEDWLGSEVGVLNGCWLDVGNWCGFVDVGGLSDGVGDGAQLGGDLGESLGGDDSVSEVASETVALDGCAVVLGGTDDVGGSGDRADGAGDQACVGNSQKTSENKEGLEKKKRCFLF